MSSQSSTRLLCAACKQHKSVNEFSLNQLSKCGTSTRCKNCLADVGLTNNKKVSCPAPTPPLPPEVAEVTTSSPPQKKQKVVVVAAAAAAAAPTPAAAAAAVNIKQVSKENYIQPSDAKREDVMLDQAEDEIEKKPATAQEKREYLIQEGSACIQHAVKVWKKTGRRCVAYDFDNLRDMIKKNSATIGKGKDDNQDLSYLTPFLKEEPTEATLVGKYDIIFHWRKYDWHNTETTIERTSRGELRLRVNNGHGWREGDFVVGICMSPKTEEKGINDYAVEHYDFACSRPQQRNNGGLLPWWSAEIWNDDEGMDNISGKLTILDKSFDLPWLVKEGQSNSDRCSIEEVKEFLKRPNYNESWLCHGHGELPPLDLKSVDLIHQYATWRPEPVFSLKPGDIFLTFNICDRFEEELFAESCIIARKTSDDPYEEGLSNEESDEESDEESSSPPNDSPATPAPAAASHPRICSLCKEPKREEDFSKEEWETDAHQRKCGSCIDKNQCTTCSKIMLQSEFSPEEYKKPNSDLVYRTCIGCEKANVRKCVICKTIKDVSNEYKQYTEPVCRECVEKVGTTDCITCGFTKQYREGMVFMGFEKGGSWPMGGARFACRDCLDDAVDQAEDRIKKQHESKKENRMQEGAVCIRNALILRKETNGCVAYDFENFREYVNDTAFTIGDYIPEGEQDSDSGSDSDADDQFSDIEEDSNVEDDQDLGNLPALCNPNVFLKERPTKAELYGEYDIIFHARRYETVGVCLERTSRGTLILKDDSERRGEGAFHISVSMDPQTAWIDPKMAQWFGEEDVYYQETIEESGFDVVDSSVRGYTFCAGTNKQIVERGKREHWCAYVWNEEDQGIPERFIRGQFQILGESFDLPWLVKEGESKNQRCGIEEAKEFLNHPNYSESWLCRGYAGLPSLDAQSVNLIHQYATWRPDPVFSLMPGDVWLNVGWRHQINPFEKEVGKLSIFARKKTNSKDEAQSND